MALFVLPNCMPSCACRIKSLAAQFLEAHNNKDFSGNMLRRNASFFSRCGSKGEQFFNEKLVLLLKHLLLGEGVSLLVCQMPAVQVTWYSTRGVGAGFKAGLLKRTAIVNAMCETALGILTIKSSVS